MDGAIGCHCSQCRRTSGHYTAGALVRRDGVIITEESGLSWYQSSPEARRGFCAECGSSVLWDYVAGDAMGIFLGSLDTPTGLRLASHIFVDDKSDYYEIDDGLPQFEGYDRPVGTADGS